MLTITYSLYILLIPFFCYAIALTIILFLASYFFIPRLEDNEKLSPYECGFDPFEDTRTMFDVKFYLVAILFIIFDLEIVLLFPWSISLFYLHFFGYIIVVLFLLILTIGFFYEWALGALDWD
jgi:NADH-quinone oxidoreductase subunit A